LQPAITVAVIVEPVFKKWEFVPIIVNIGINPEKLFLFVFYLVKKYYNTKLFKKSRNKHFEKKKRINYFNG
jgi:hypothetical protein